MSLEIVKVVFVVGSGLVKGDREGGSGVGKVWLRFVFFVYVKC